MPLTMTWFGLSDARDYDTGEACFENNWRSGCCVHIEGVEYQNRTFTVSVEFPRDPKREQSNVYENLGEPTEG